MKTTRNTSSGISCKRRWQTGKRAVIAPSGIVLFIVILFGIIGGQKSFGQGVGISETSIVPHASSILELRSSLRGFLAPRMTTAERIAIATPAQGLLVFDTTTQSFWYFETTWKTIASGTLGSGNQLLGMNAGGTANEYKTLLGTPNRISVTHAAGSITLSTPQDIHTGAAPTFAGLTVSGLTPNSGVYTNGINALTSSPPTSGILGYWSRTGNILSPTTAGDYVTTSGNIYTTGTGTITSAGLLTGQTGATVTGATTMSAGIISLNNSSDFATNINTGTSSGNVTIGNSLNSIYLPKFITAGLVHNDAAGLLSTGLLLNNDITNGTIDLTTKVTNILPIANGGTNSGTALSGQSIVISNGTAIVQGSAGTTTTLLHGNAAGAPTYGQVVNADIANGTIDLLSKVTNVLPVVNGGTGQSSYVNGELLIGNTTGNTLTKTTLTGTVNQVNVTNGNGSITLSTPQNIHTGASPTFVGLTLSGLTANSGVYTNGTSGLTSTPPTAGTIGYWDRTGTILSPTTLGDAITTTGNVYTTGTGTITSAGLLTGQSGATITGATTVTGGVVNLNNGSNFATNINTGTSTGNVTIGNLLSSLYLPKFTSPGILHNDATGLVTSSQISLTTDITGILTVPNGGTGISDITTNNLIYGNGTNPVSLLAPGGTTGAILTTTATGAPGWLTLNTLPVTSGILPIANGGTNSGTALAGSSIIISDGTSIIQGDKGTNTTLLHGNAAGAPAYGQVVNADIANGTIDLLSKVTNVLPVVNGGTGQSSYVNGEILIGNTTGNTLTKTTLTGTTNQVNVANGPGSITLSTPQDIHVGASPEFVGLTLSGLSPSAGVYTDASRKLTSAPPSSGTIGYWSRDDIGKILSPSNLGDHITTSGNIYSTGTGTITSAGLLTGQTGATVTGATTISDGIINLNNGSDFATNINTGTSSGNVTIGNLLSSLYLPKFTSPGILHNDATGLVTSSQISLTTDITGILTVPNGGTGISDITTNNLIYGNGTNPVSLLAPGGTTGAILTTTATGAPGWLTLNTLPATAGILPIANGGTNSGTALNNGRVMVSRGDKIVEAGAMTNGQVIVGSTGVDPQIVTMGGDITIDNAGATTIGTGKVLNGMLAADVVTSNKILDGTIVNADINVAAAIDAAKLADGSVSNTELQYINTLTSNAQTQFDNLGTQIGGINTLSDGKIYLGDVTNTAQEVTVTGDITMTNAGATTISNSAVTTAKILDGTILNADISDGAIDLTTKVTNVLPVVNGGTNSGTALNNGRVMVSRGDKIVEAGAMTNGQVIVGSTGVDPQIVSMGGDITIDNAGETTIGTGKVVNGMLAADAVTSNKILDGEVKTADIADANVTSSKILDANVTVSKLGTSGVPDANRVYTTNGTGVPTLIPISAFASSILPDGQIFIGDPGNVAVGRTMSGDATITNLGVLTISNDAVTSGKILDGTIVNADINAAAAIDATKIAAGTVDNTEFGYINGVTSAIQTQFNNIQSELDVTQTGSGLNNDGTYTANGVANYISGATSLKIADNLLDAQVKLNTDAIAAGNTDLTDLQTEVNTIETGSGLNADGTYAANGSANYISGATSLAAADNLLDTQLKTTTDDLTSEVTRATTAEGVISGNLASEITRATAAEGTLTTNLATEVTDRINGDATLTTSLATEVTNRTAADASIQSELDVTQTGSGLNNDGTYTANGAANYISGATSLKIADNLLDAQVKSNTDIIALKANISGQVFTGAISATNLSGTNTGDQTLAGLGGVPATRTVNGKSLASDITLGLASADFANQGTTTTVLHGNAAGNPTWSQIVNSDIDPAAGIAYSKLANLTSGNILVGSATNVPTSTSVTGDVTISNTGVTSIGAYKVTNGMLNGSITSSKLVGTDIATVGTITSGIWNAGAVTSSGAVTGNSIVKTGGLATQFLKANGSVDANTYVTSAGTVTNFTGSLAGDVSGTQGATVIGAGKVTNSMLAGSIASAKLIGTDIATVGTITSGIWNAGAVTSSGAVTGNSIVKTGGLATQFLKANGSVDANTYVTSAGTVTNFSGSLAGDVSGTQGATVIGAGKVTNSMLAGLISSAKLIGTDIATVGTITSGIWNAGAVTSSGAVTGNSIVKTGGLASQFLKADGSIDANSYITGNQSITFNPAAGDVTGSASGTTSLTPALTISNNAVTNAKFRQGAARSVVGVTGNAAANVADITGTTDQVLRVNGAGNALTFGSIDLSKSATVGTSILPVANGGTGSSSQNFVDLTTLQTIAGTKTWSNLATFNAGIISTGGPISLNNNSAANTTNIGTGTTTGAVAIGSANNTVSILGTIPGANPLVFDGATADANRTTFAITDPTGSNTITFPNASGTVALVGGAASWSTLGNAGTTGANFIGTSDAQDLIFKANGNEVGRLESATGFFKMGNAISGTIKATKELIFTEEGGTFGTSILRIKNEVGENGAIFETKPTIPTTSLVDFIFKTSVDASNTIQRNIRFEARPASAQSGTPSFHIGGATGLGVADPDHPTLSVGDNYSIFKNKVKIGDNTYTAPTALLHLAAGTATANTAPLKFTSGTDLAAVEDGTVEYDGTSFHASTGGVRAIITRSLSGTFATNIDSIPALTSTTFNITVTGAADGDPVSLGVPIAATNQWLIYTAWVSAANTVTVRVINWNTTIAQDPGPGTFRAGVLKY